MHRATCMSASRVGRCDCTISECICCMKGKLQGFPCISGMPSGRALLLGLEKVEDKQVFEQPYCEHLTAQNLEQFGQPYCQHLNAQNLEQSQNQADYFKVHTVASSISHSLVCPIDLHSKIAMLSTADSVNIFPAPTLNFWQIGFHSVG